MRRIEQDLVGALDELEALTARLREEGAAVDLTGCLERLDRLTAGLPPGTDARLRHFLVGRSYQKARLWLGQHGVHGPSSASSITDAGPDRSSVA